MGWKTVALSLLVLSLSLPATAVPPLPRGPEFQVNTNTLAYHYDPAVAVFPDGGFVAVWTAGPRFDEPGRRVIHARLFDRQGKPESGEFRLVDRTAGSQFPYRVVADRDGSFLVSWNEVTPKRRSSVYVRRFNRDGTPRGETIRVHAPSTSDRSNGVIAIGADGRFAVAWEARRPSSYYTDAVARVFSAEGAPLTPETRISRRGITFIFDEVHVYPEGLALTPDGSLMALIRHSGEGCIDSEVIYVPLDGRRRRAYKLNPSYNCVSTEWGGSLLVMGQDGSAVAVWTEFELIAQRFGPKGEPRGDRFYVNEKGIGLQNSGAVAVQADGSFVIVWTEDEGRDGDESGIFARAFAADGAPLTRDLQINQTTQGCQYASAIGAAPQGPMIVVWTHTGEDGRADIFARVLTANP